MKRLQIILLFLLSTTAFSQNLSTIINSGRLTELRWPNFSNYRPQLINFYRPTAYQPAWVRDGQPTPQALAIVQILENADQEGLRAEDYDASRWPARLASLQEAPFDAALTICLMRYLSDLHVGRINPQHLGFEFDISQKKLNLAQFIRQQLVNGTGLPTKVAAVEPPVPGYQRLREALQHYEELAKRGDGEKVPDLGYVAPGGQYAAIPQLANRMRLLGDLPENTVIPADTKTYTGALVDAVKHFQARHGLRTTGELDLDTLAAINVPLSDRVEQIRLSLERYRWLPYEFKQSPVVVNIPEFRLYGDGISLNVNVGDQYDFQTPIFENNIQYIVFRPYWYPPRSILRSEIIPPLEQDPDLEDNDLELVTPAGKVISSGNVTPAMLQQMRAGTLTVRQPPGPGNALGLVKFIFPNAHDVYIHDTPQSMNMFSDTEQTFSHGCIHVQEPAKLAVWLLRNNPGWDLERVKKAMHDGNDNQRVNLAFPIPVLIVYLTAVAEQNGEVHFFEDIYGHDAELKQELAKGYARGK